MSDTITVEEALRVAHRLWSETPYPEGKREEHKLLWRQLVEFLEEVKRRGQSVTDGVTTVKIVVKPDREST